MTSRFDKSQAARRRLKTLVGAAVLALSPTVTQAAERPVLVFGASGRLGVAIVRNLPSDVGPVTAFVRPSSDRAPLMSLVARYVEGDVLNAEDVARALRTVRPEIVVNALARRDFKGAFYDISQGHITAAAKATGVKQIVFTSALGAGDSRAVYPDFRWKMFGPAIMEKDRAEKELIASGVGYTIIRNDQIVSDTVAPTGKARLTDNQHAMGAITRADLGVLMAGCVAAARCMNKIFHAVDTIPFVPSAP